MSLGIDLVPHKVCTFNCIYCECGATTNLTSERKEYIKYNEIIDELQHYLKNNLPPDYITFSGAGEPTLNFFLENIIGFIKSINTHIPVAVITNGSLFGQKDVRKALMNADLVLPSLDAANESTYKKINRPCPDISLNTYIDGLIMFRKDFSGQIWLEVMIIPSYNDDIENLELLKEAILKINPDKIQLNTLDRPGVIENINAASFDELQKILDLWKDLKNVEIIAPAAKRKKQESYRKDVENAILETISRRPCTLDDLQIILGYHGNEINKYLDVLEKEHMIISERQARGLFYRIDPESLNKEI